MVVSYEMVPQTCHAWPCELLTRLSRMNAMVMNEMTLND